MSGHDRRHVRLLVQGTSQLGAAAVAASQLADAGYAAASLRHGFGSGRIHLVT